MPPRTAERPVVLVTGASSGVGRATAQQFGGRGAVVVLVARGRPALEQAAVEVRGAGGAEAVVCPADVTDEDAVRAVVESTVARFGRLDVVVHSAQVMAYGRIEEVPAKVYEAVVDTALHGTANVARTVLPVFRRQEAGSLVIVSSLLASVATPLMGSYIAAKWGQLGLVRVLQQEVRDAPGVSVTAVAPGGVNTPIYVQGASYMGSTGRPPPPVYSAERVARKVVGAVDRPRRLVQAGVLNPLLKVAATARDSIGPTVGNVFESRPEGNDTHGRWRSI